MPDEAVLRGDAPPTVRSRLVANLRSLGVRPGGVPMVHARVSALGWAVGGTGTVVLALLDALGPDGTLTAYAGWEDDSYGMDGWPAAWRDAYAAELPPFDPATAEAAHATGRLPERVRTWPGAHRGRHPEAGMVALGPRAAWLTADHPWDDPYGPGSPWAKLVAADGQVLMLGAPLDTLTLPHHAEATARVPTKRRVVYRMPLLERAAPSGGSSATSTPPAAPSRTRRSRTRSWRPPGSSPPRRRLRQLPAKPWRPASAAPATSA